MLSLLGVKWPLEVVEVARSEGTAVVEVPVLDKGFVRLVDVMGDDNAIVQAARVSYGEGTKTVREDAALTLRFL